MEKLVKFVIALFIIILIISLISGANNWITEDKAIERIKEITKTEDIIVIRHSNLNPVFGDPHDVTFELKVDGKFVSARCTSGIFSEMICRVYSSDEVD